MELAKQYAIRCSTEEQARELTKWYSKLTGVYIQEGDQWKLMNNYDNKCFIIKGELKWIYTIITYEEAKKMGLLGEKNEGCFYCGSLEPCTCDEDEINESNRRDEPQQNEVQELKLLGTDTEDGITCEIRGYWKDGICYVKDVINKRVEDIVQETPIDYTSDEQMEINEMINEESPSEDNLVEFAIRLKERFPSTPIKEILIEVKQHLLSK